MEACKLLTRCDCRLLRFPPIRGRPVVEELCCVVQRIRAGVEIHGTGMDRTRCYSSGLGFVGCYLLS